MVVITAQSIDADATRRLYDLVDTVGRRRKTTGELAASRRRRGPGRSKLFRLATTIPDGSSHDVVSESATTTPARLNFDRKSSFRPNAISLLAGQRRTDGRGGARRVRSVGSTMPVSPHTAYRTVVSIIGLRRLKRPLTVYERVVRACRPYGDKSGLALMSGISRLGERCVGGWGYAARCCIVVVSSPLVYCAAIPLADRIRHIACCLFIHPSVNLSLWLVTLGTHNIRLHMIRDAI